MVAPTGKCQRECLMLFELQREEIGHRDKIRVGEPTF